MIKQNGEKEQVVGVMIDGKSARGFGTPSRKLEFYSKTLADWKWAEHAIPGYVAQPRLLARPRSSEGASFYLSRPSGSRR